MESLALAPRLGVRGLGFVRFGSVWFGGSDLSLTNQNELELIRAKPNKRFADEESVALGYEKLVFGSASDHVGALMNCENLI